MNNLLAIPMMFVGLVSFSSGHHLKVGYYANSDPTCMKNYGYTSCTDEHEPICAILNNEYVTGTNLCNFCSVYGNTEATILQIGIPPYGPFSCSPLVVGGKPTDDPQCANYYREDYQEDSSPICTFESYPICARLADGTLIGGGNKCLFCTIYGQADATIKALGRECNPEQYLVVVG